MRPLLLLVIISCSAPPHPIENRAGSKADPPWTPWSSLATKERFVLASQIDEDHILQIDVIETGRVVKLQWLLRYGQEVERTWTTETRVDDHVRIQFQADRPIAYPHATRWSVVTRDSSLSIDQKAGATCYISGRGSEPPNGVLECGACIDEICIHPDAGITRAAVWEIVDRGIFVTAR